MADVCLQHNKNCSYLCEKCTTPVCSVCLEKICNVCHQDLGNGEKCPTCLDKSVQSSIGACSECNYGRCEYHSIRVSEFPSMIFCSNYCVAGHIGRAISHYQELHRMYRSLAEIDRETWSIKLNIVRRCRNLIKNEIFEITIHDKYITN